MSNSFPQNRGNPPENPVDVTLVYDDDRLISAHKVILATLAFL